MRWFSLYFVLMTCCVGAWEGIYMYDDGILQHQWYSGVMRCRSQIAPSGEIVALVESLRPNTLVRVDEVVGIDGEYLVRGYMGVSEPFHRSGWDLKPITLILEPKEVSVITLKGEEVCKSGDVTVLAPRKDILATLNSKSLLALPPPGEIASIAALSEPAPLEDNAPLMTYPLREQVIEKRGEVRYLQGPGELLCQSQVTPDGEITILLQGAKSNTDVTFSRLWLEEDNCVVRAFVLVDLEPHLDFPAKSGKEIEIPVRPQEVEQVTLTGRTVHQADRVRVLVPWGQGPVLASGPLGKRVR
jgi:hypothetical protein